MAQKSVSVECSECDMKYAVATPHAEAIQFCCFCGAGLILPYEDIEDDELFSGLDDDEVDEFTVNDDY